MLLKCAILGQSSSQSTAVNLMCMWAQSQGTLGKLQGRGKPSLRCFHDPGIYNAESRTRCASPQLHCPETARRIWSMHAASYGSLSRSSAGRR